MECPKCGKRMKRKSKVWECPSCGYNFVKNNDDDLFTNMGDSDISNKIKEYRESNDKMGKIIDGIGNIAENVSVQVKKEEAYIKNRKNEDSTVLVDNNELVISKVIFDGVDFVSAKKQERNEAKKIKNSQRKEDVGVKKTKKEEEIKRDGRIVEDETELEQEVSVDKTDVATEEPIEEKVKSSKGKTVNPSTKPTQNKKKDNNSKKQKKGIGRKIMDFNLGNVIMDKGKELVEEEKREILEKISPLLPEYAKMLNTTPDKLYVTSLASNYQFRGTKYDTTLRRDGVVMTIEDSQISYITFGMIVGKNITFFDTMDTYSIAFKNITSITDNFLNIELKMVGDNSINIRAKDYFGKRFLTELVGKYNQFNSGSSVTENNTTNKDTSKADELLKYAELYKQGLLSEEEFEAKKKELL